MKLNPPFIVWGIERCINMYISYRYFFFVSSFFSFILLACYEGCLLCSKWKWIKLSRVSTICWIFSFFSLLFFCAMPWFFLGFHVSRINQIFLYIQILLLHQERKKNFLIDSFLTLFCCSFIWDFFFLYEMCINIFDTSHSTFKCLHSIYFM